MTKSEFIREVSIRTGLTISDTNLVCGIMFDVLKEGINRDDKVLFSGFGTFTKKYRKARVTRNPKTGEKVNVPAKREPSFKACKKFKNEIY